MKVKLTILSRGDGWTDSVQKTAVMSFDGEYAVINYEIDGDDCVLKLARDRVEQTRTGGVDISFSAVKGGAGFCRIGDGSASGGYPVVCRELRCITGARGADASLEYYSGADSELIKMKIRAVALERN